MRRIGRRTRRGLSSGVVDRLRGLRRAFTLNQSLGIAFSVGKVGAYCIRPTCTWRRIIHPLRGAFYGAYASAPASEYSSNNRLTIARSSG